MKVPLPFCPGRWFGTGFVGGYLIAPRATRTVANTFTAVALSDALQFAYAALQRSQQ